MLPGYKYLLTYRYSEIVHDLTEEFCLGYLSHLGNLGYLGRQRTVAQMTHAARSGKQNIVEGVGQSKTSKKGEIKLLGVAKASIDELIADYEDFLRQRSLLQWEKTDPRIQSLRNLGMAATRQYPVAKPSLPKDPETAANMLLTFSHQLTYLLEKQIAAAEKKFIEEGGFTESLFKKRLTHRSHK